MGASLIGTFVNENIQTDHKILLYNSPLALIVSEVIKTAGEQAQGKRKSDTIKMVTVAEDVHKAVRLIRMVG